MDLGASPSHPREPTELSLSTGASYAHPAPWVTVPSPVCCKPDFQAPAFFTPARAVAPVQLPAFCTSSVWLLRGPLCSMLAGGQVGEGGCPLARCGELAATTGSRKLSEQLSPEPAQTIARCTPPHLPCPPLPLEHASAAPSLLAGAGSSSSFAPVLLHNW